MTCQHTSATTPNAALGHRLVLDDRPDTSRPPAKRLHLAPSMLVDSIESGPSSDGGTDTLIARRAGRLQFPNAIQRQRYIATTMAISKVCGDP